MSMMHTLKCALAQGNRGMIPSFFQTLESPAVDDYKLQQEMALTKAINAKADCGQNEEDEAEAKEKEEREEVLELSKEGEDKLDKGAGIEDAKEEEEYLFKSLSALHTGDTNEEKEDLFRGSTSSIGSQPRKSTMNLVGIKVKPEQKKKKSVFKKLGKSISKVVRVKGEY